MSKEVTLKLTRREAEVIATVLNLVIGPSALRKALTPQAFKHVTSAMKKLDKTLKEFYTKAANGPKAGN